MATSRAWGGWFTSMAVFAALMPQVARADATVLVELKGPGGENVEGTVQLSKGDAKHHCTTDKAGRCSISGVAGGMYTVSVEQNGKSAPKDRKVAIPPTGEVKLIVNAN